MQSIYLVGGGLIIEANIPVQEFEGQRGEGAYFRRGLIFGRIWYFIINDNSVEIKPVTVIPVLFHAVSISYNAAFSCDYAIHTSHLYCMH